MAFLSFTGVNRPALFKKGTDTLGKILGRGTGGKALGFASQLRIESVAGRRLKQPLGSPVGVGWSRCEPSRQCGSFRVERLRRDDAVDEPERQRARCVEPIAEQHQLRRGLEADDAGERRRHPAIWAGAEMDIARGKDRILGGDCQIGRQNEAEPKPIVAAVQGAAAGFGLSLVLAADLAVAAEDTVFTSGYIHLGTSPDGGM